MALFLNVLGWYCPSTYLENYLRMSCGDDGSYGSSFITNYLESIIYPDLPETIIRIGEVVFVCLNLIGYGIIAKRYLRGRNPFA
jgi:hypothetical protein